MGWHMLLALQLLVPSGGATRIFSTGGLSSWLLIHRSLHLVMIGCILSSQWGGGRGATAQQATTISAPRVWQMAAMRTTQIIIFLFFLVGYVEERPWWPIKSPNKGRELATGRKEWVEDTFGSRYPGTPTRRFLRCPLQKANGCDMQ